MMQMLIKTSDTPQSKTRLISFSMIWNKNFEKHISRVQFWDPMFIYDLFNFSELIFLRTLRTATSIPLTITPQKSI